MKMFNFAFELAFVLFPKISSSLLQYSNKQFTYISGDSIGAEIVEFSMTVDMVGRRTPVLFALLAV